MLISDMRRETLNHDLLRLPLGKKPKQNVKKFYRLLGKSRGERFFSDLLNQISVTIQISCTNI
jgi:hypothetical protein